MKNKRDIFYFEPGKYVVGDIVNLFEERDFKKIKNTLSKVKAKSGLNKKFNLHFFRGIDRKYIDYIEYNSYILCDNCLVLAPDDIVKTGRLTNCKRITTKYPFSVEYINDSLGVVVYFKEFDAPSPFMMLVQEIDTK